jgi:hypothetical protein
MKLKKNNIFLKDILYVEVCIYIYIYVCVCVWVNWVA